MRKDIRPKIDATDLGLNPFVTNLTIPVNCVIQAHQYYKDEDGDFLNVELKLEATEYVKLFDTPDVCDKLCALTNGGQRLLFWILQNCSTDTDYIWLNHRRYMDKNGISSIDTYKAAYKDLVKGGFIQLTIVPHVYWINPYMFWKGNRITSFPEKVQYNNEPTTRLKFKRKQAQ